MCQNWAKLKFVFTCLNAMFSQWIFTSIKIIMWIEICFCFRKVIKIFLKIIFFPYHPTFFFPACYRKQNIYFVWPYITTFIHNQFLYIPKRAGTSLSLPTLLLCLVWESGCVYDSIIPPYIHPPPYCKHIHIRIGT